MWSLQSDPELIHQRSFSASRGILAFLFLSESDGVQLGDHMLQENYFAYVVTPNIEIGQLLRDDENLRQSVIDGVQELAGGAARAPSLSVPLQQAASAAASSLQIGSVNGVVIRPFAGGSCVLSDRDGVSVGCSVAQTNQVTTRLNQLGIEDDGALDGLRDSIEPQVDLGSPRGIGDDWYDHVLGEDALNELGPPDDVQRGRYTSPYDSPGQL
jgi:hypothetical protein